MQHASIKKPKSVRSLYGRHQGETIYVVGSGASMRVFPADFLADKVTIGLNMAWKNAPVTYGITIHPDLNVPEFMDGEEPRPEITWISALDKSTKVLDGAELAYALKHFYFFRHDGQPDTSRRLEPPNSGRVLDWIRSPVGDFLYVWSSISQTAANLAANMGAKNVVMVGCDSCSLSGNYHGHLQHTWFKGVTPDQKYRQFYEGLSEVRSALRQRDVEMCSMTPFVGLNFYQDDFRTLCAELGREALIEGKDLSHHPIVYWIAGLRRPVFRFFEKLHLVEEIRAVKRWLGAK